MANRASLLSDPMVVVPTAARLGFFDPLLNVARFCGVGRWGPGIAGSVAAAAARFPTRAAVVDDDGQVTYRVFDRQSTNVAGHIRARVRGGAVGILCRNHRGFLLAQVGAERAGRDVVMVSTALPVAQLIEVVGRESISLLIADEEFLPLITEAGLESITVVADSDGPESLVSLAKVRRSCPPPRRRARLVLLTSGTTGPPKGARRANRASVAETVAIFERLPYRVGDVYYVAPPLFHAWGLTQSTIALSTASTLHLRRAFDPHAALELLAEHAIDVLAVVPLMLRRMLRVADDVADVQPARVVMSSGNVLSGDLATAWMDRFGDRLYNLYGSTETAIATIGDPADLRSAPGTVGRPPDRVTLAILDDEGMPVGIGQRGWVYVGNSMHFDGYTDGQMREKTGTLMATGDLGHVTETGQLFISGRANDMIVTGGENVFPSVVEEALERQPNVLITAVVGIDDEDFGQRIVAFVVPQAGPLDTDALKTALTTELSSYMVPKEIRVVDALPMTTTGKVIRHRLAVLGETERI